MKHAMITLHIDQVIVKVKLLSMHNNMRTHYVINYIMRMCNNYPLGSRRSHRASRILGIPSNHVRRKRRMQRLQENLQKRKHLYKNVIQIVDILLLSFKKLSPYPMTMFVEMGGQLLETKVIEYDVCKT